MISGLSKNVYYYMQTDISKETKGFFSPRQPGKSTSGMFYDFIIPL